MINFASYRKGLVTMHRIDRNTVEFTTISEQRAKARFDDRLDQGDGIPKAAYNALAFFMAQGHRFSSDFIDYLSEGTLIGNRNSGTLHTSAKGRDCGMTYPIPS